MNQTTQHQESKDVAVKATAAGLIANSLATNLQKRIIPKTKFNTFEDVKKLVLSDIKRGDVIFFNATDNVSPLHPVIVTDPRHIDYPSADTRNTRGMKIVSGIDAPRDSTRPIRLQGRFIDFGPDEGVVEEPLEQYLYERTHFKKIVDGKEIRTFSPELASRIRGIYRLPEFDNNSFSETLKNIRANKTGYRYKLFPKKVFNLSDCSNGTCINFTDGLLRGIAKEDTLKNTHLPETLLQRFKAVKEFNAQNIRNLSVATPFIAGTGVGLLHKGLKKEDPTTVATGAALIGGGIAASMHKPLRLGANALSSMATQTVGDTLILKPLEYINKLIYKTNAAEHLKYIPTANVRNFLDRHTLPSKVLGGTILAAPILYGMKKLIED